MTKVVFPLNPYGFTTSAFLIGLILVQELSSEEQDSIGNWLQLVGLTMQTFASQKVTLEAIHTTEQDTDQNKYEILQKAIQRMEEEIKKWNKENKNAKKI